MEWALQKLVDVRKVRKLENRSIEIIQSGEQRGKMKKNEQTLMVIVPNSVMQRGGNKYLKK